MKVEPTFRFLNLSSSSPGILLIIEHFRCTTSSCESTRMYFSLYAYIIENVILLWLNLRKYGSSFMYSRKSFIQPMFHLSEKPRPSSSGFPVTFGHAVDSSAIMTVP